jgi:secondary thiamine-phosphate synthase enzyme
MSNMFEIPVKSQKRNQLIDITDEVQRRVSDSGAKNGIAHIYVPHTTAAITVNENADPTVQTDVATFLERLVPRDADFQHTEGNSDAHMKSSLVGCHISVFVSNGKIALGTWQGIFFCEFDGPRSRKVLMKIIPD